MHDLLQRTPRRRTPRRTAGRRDRRSRTRSRALRQPPRAGRSQNRIFRIYPPTSRRSTFRTERLMCNMSRIRNTLRFQTPEERVLNGLLALVLIVLLTVAVAKVRDDRVEAASEVKGETVTRVLPRTGGRERTTTTTVAPTTTTVTVSPAELFAFALAVQENARRAGRTTTTTTVAAPGPGPTASSPPPVDTPTTTVTTRPRTTTTSTSSTSTTTSTTGPPLQGG